MTGDHSLRVVLVVDPKLPVPPQGYGGTQRIAGALARGLVARGHRVTVVAGPGSSTPGARDVTVRYRYPAARLKRAWWYLRFALIVGYHSRRSDVLVSFWRDDFLGGVLPRDLPVVLTHHVAVGQALVEFPGRPVLHVSVSDQQRSHLPDRSWRTVHNGVDSGFFSPSPGRIGGYVAFLGRLSPEKGAGTAVRVARRAGVPIVIGGNLPDDPASRAAFERDVAPHLGDEVRWLGELDDAGKLELLREADALLFPITGHEAFGLVMAESLACGTPVIALRAGATPEVVRDGVTGFVCDDEDAMVAAIARVGEIDRAMCRADCVERFSGEAMVEGYLAVIREVTGGRPRPEPPAQ